MNTATTRSLLARIGATVVLAAVLVGAPVALSLGGSPLPVHWPDLSHAFDDLRVGYVASGTLRRVALDAAWLAWLFLTYEIAAECSSVLRRQVSRPTSVLGPLQPAVAKLVAVALLSLPLLAMKPTLRSAAASTSIQVAVASARSETTSRSAVALPTYVVRRHDTLWGIAERYLGNPLRWTEIALLNEDRLEGSRHFTDPHWIYPGWTIVLPADAHGLPPTQQPTIGPPSAAPGAATPPVAPARTNGAATSEREVPVTRRSEPAASATTEPAASRPAGPVGPTDQEIRSGSPTPPSRSPLAPIGLGLLGVGLIGVLARYRRVQHRHRRSGRRIALPTGPLADFERSLSSPEDFDAASFLDGAFRLLGQVVRGGAHAPTILGAILSDQALEVILTEPAEAPQPFTNSADGEWQLLRSENVHSADGAVAPLPTLVTVGHDEEGVVLLNLEAGGSVSIDGDPGVAAELANAVGLELASAPWCEAVQLIDIGIGTELAEKDRCTSLGTLENALPRLRAHLAATHAELVEVGETDAGQARLVDPAEAWSSCALVTNTPPSEAEIAALDDLEEPARHALVLLAPGDWPGAQWQLHAMSDGTIEVPMLGRRVQAQRVSATHLAGIAALLGLAARHEDVAATSAPYDHIELPVEAVPPVSIGEVETPTFFAAAETTEQEEPITPEPPERTSLAAVPTPPVERSIEVGVLGPICCTGLDRDPDRPKTLELIVWMALHPGVVTTDTLATALWPTQGYSERSLWNRISDARRCLGPGPDGKPLLERTSGLELSPSVGSDWARFRRLSASENPAERASALLLVRGMPFQGVDWPWATVDGFAASIEAEVTDLAEAIAEEALLNGDPHEATRAADIGILTSPYDERLYRLLMRAADAEGNPAGVRATMQRLAIVLEAEIEPLESVHPETRMLYEALTRRRRTSEQSSNHDGARARHMA